MASRRLSRLQRRLLRHLFLSHQRTRGTLAMSHLELVQAIGGDRSNVGHSLRTLEARGLITIGRSPGGKAEDVALTSEGLQLTSEMASSGE
jgi:DNA-binding MarR family transcriptional regulator